ncbi:hypothetical protein EIP86_009897 [Pleurotus ostreatoroseus]|nr:hypothetical protein EIP86_009897 [Pleurotus ostreatoroseus]
MSYLSEWFVRRRGLANGILFSGLSVAGILFPLLFPPLIARFGPAKLVRGYALALLVGMVPALLFVKPRLPEPRVRGPHPRARRARDWLRERNFWFFAAINTVQGLGYFVPIIWLPTYASSLGFSATKGALTLALFNAAGYVACFGVGFLSDTYDVWGLAVLSLVLTASATLVLWGVLASSLAGILVYSGVYGAVAGGFSSLWSAFTRPIARDDPTLTTTIFGYMLLTRGIGNIVSTPISTALQQVHSATRAGSAHQTGFAVSDGRYQDMIIYSGACSAGAALIAVVGWTLDRRQRSG